MYRNLLKAVTDLGSPKVLLAGDFILDSYIYGDALRISPEAPVPVLKVVNRQYHCGGAGSVAADLAELGAKPLCIGAIGNDSNGQTLSSLLTQAGADISGLIKIPERPTITKQRLIGLAQHRHRQQLLRVDEECTEPYSDQQYRTILENFKQRIKQADIVCLQDYNKGLLTETLCRKFIELAVKNKKKITVDPPSHGDYARYTSASVITPNRKEASCAAGFEINTIVEAEKAASILYDRLGLEAAVITLDKEGAFLKTKDISEHIPTIPRNVYDVSGAGDMVLAMLTTAVAAGCDYQTAVHLANTAGGIEVEKFGTATVSVDEIVRELLVRNRLSAGKLRDTDTLTSELNIHRRNKQTIVFTNGCFDILHRGHVEYLRFCKAAGNVVVLGLNSDDSVRKIKGPGRPVNNQHDRCQVLNALETVDYIVIFDEPDPAKLIEKVRPDVLVKGADWAEKGVVGQKFVESYGGKVILAPLVEGKSTTDTIEKIRNCDSSTGA